MTNVGLKPAMTTNNIDNQGKISLDVYSNLGNVTSIKDYCLKWPFLDALLACWDLDHVVYRFVNEDMCPTLEEIGSLLTTTFNQPLAIPNHREGYINHVGRYVEKLGKWGNLMQSYYGAAKTFNMIC